jgi:hypothetical protein
MLEGMRKAQKLLLGMGLFVTLGFMANHCVTALAQTGDPLLDLEMRRRQRDSQQLQMNRQILARERALAKEEKDRERNLILLGGMAIGFTGYLILARPAARAKARSYLVRGLDGLKQKLEDSPAEDSADRELKKEARNAERQSEESIQPISRAGGVLVTGEVEQDQQISQRQLEFEQIILTPELVNDLILQSSMRLIFVSIITLGFYNCYWFFKTWLFLKRSQNLSINAILCSIFPVLTIYSLSKRIFSQAELVGHKEQVKPLQLPGIYFSLNLAGNTLTGLIGLVPSMFLFYPILPIHRALSAYIQRSYPEYKEREFFSGGMVGWIISGSLLWLLLLLGAVTPDSSQARITKVSISPKTSRELVSVPSETGIAPESSKKRQIAD